MESSEEKNIIVARLDDGEDVISSIMALSKKHGLKGGLIVSGIGMLEDVVLGFFDGEKYLEKRLEGSYELVGMHGSIAEGSVHIHAVLGDEDCGAKSGHLLRAKVKVQNELMIQRFDDIELTRKNKGNVKILGVRN